LTETTQGNESNGTEQPRRARSSTERSRAHRAKKKLEREAALKAEAERVAEAVAGVPGDAENAVADAGPGPAEQQAEREAAALHEAERAEREADATETATIERVAGRVADVADTVAPQNAVSSLLTVDVAGVPAVSTPVEWRTVERPVWRPAWRPTVLSLDAQPPAHPDAQRAHPAQPGSGVLAWCCWLLGGLFALMSLVLYGASLFLNATFWPGLAPTEGAKAIVGVVAVVVETSNFSIPSAVSIAPMSRAFKRVLWGFWIVTMITAAVAGASFVRSNLGAAEVSRQATIDKRDRAQRTIDAPMAPVSDGAVVDARKRVETATANRKTDCPRNKSLDIEVCNRAKAAVEKAEAALAIENTRHADDVKAAEQRHREAVAKAEADLKELPPTSKDKNVVLAGVAALVPWASESEDAVNGLVVWLWLALLSFGPCLFLRGAVFLLLARLRTTVAG
jgi:hypothetical protein